MGYYVDMEMIDVKFPVSKEKEFWKIMKRLDKDDAKKSGGHYNGGKIISQHYAWVKPDFSTRKTVEDVFDEWRYEVSRIGDYYVVECFNGTKLGDDEVLWSALAPIMDPDSQIECEGEDGCRWRWIFEDGKFREQVGKIVYVD